MLQPDDDDLLTSEEAARLLRSKVGTLAAWRSRRIGPPWIAVSERMPRYSRRELMAWLASREVDADSIQRRRDELAAIAEGAPPTKAAP